MLNFILIGIIVFLLFRKTREGRGEDLHILLRQSARYATAALQDESPLIATLHVNYAAAYFYAARDIASENEIFNSTGIDVHEYKKHLNKIQDTVSKRTIGACPAFSGDVDIYIASIAGEA